MVEYEKEFNHLSKNALESFITEAFQCRQFEDGPNESEKRYPAPVTVLQQVNFYQLVQATMKVEKSEASSKERFQKRKLFRGASSSSSKRARESQTESVHSFAIRGRRQGNTVVPSTSRGALAGPGGIVSETIDRHMPTVPARAYAMKARRDQDAP